MVKERFADQIKQLMKENNVFKVDLARYLSTSRMQVDRILNPHNSSITLHTLLCVCSVFKKDLKISFVNENAEDHK